MRSLESISLWKKPLGWNLLCCLDRKKPYFPQQNSENRDLKKDFFKNAFLSYYNKITVFGLSSVSFNFQSCISLPPKKITPTDPACLNLFIRTTKDVVAECGHRLLEAVCVPPSTVQIFLLLKRKSGRKIPRVPWLPDYGWSTYPPNVPPPEIAGLMIRACWPLASLNKALLSPYFWGGTLYSGGVGWLAMSWCFCSEFFVVPWNNRSSKKKPAATINPIVITPLQKWWTIGKCISGFKHGYFGYLISNFQGSNSDQTI